MARTGRPRTIPDPPLRTEFGHGVLVSLVSISGERGGVLLCSCGSEYAALLRDLTKGKVTSCGCGGHSWDKRVSRRQQDGARQLALDAARAVLDGSEYEVLSVAVRRVT